MAAFSMPAPLTSWIPTDAAKIIAVFDLISDAMPFGRLWYGEANAINNAIGYAKFRSRSHEAVIRVYDKAGNVIETREHAGRFQGVVSETGSKKPPSREL